MKKTIIIVRHGETTKNKTNSDRGLTLVGRKQMVLSATKIKKLLSPKGKIAIVFGNSRRTMLSANIISTMLNNSVVFSSPNLRLEGFSRFAERLSNPVQRYIESSLNNKLPEYVETPAIAINKFNSVTDSLLSRFDVIIVVSHGGFLDVIAKFHPLFIKANRTPINYGKFRHIFFEDNL
jgi:broad specificity phosphatase PhoE